MTDDGGQETDYTLIMSHTTNIFPSLRGKSGVVSGGGSPTPETGAYGPVFPVVPTQTFGPTAFTAGLHSFH